MSDFNARGNLPHIAAVRPFPKGHPAPHIPPTPLQNQALACAASGHPALGTTARKRGKTGRGRGRGRLLACLNALVVGEGHGLGLQPVLNDDAAAHEGHHEVPNHEECLVQGKVPRVFHQRLAGGGGVILTIHLTTTMGEGEAGPSMSDFPVSPNGCCLQRGAPNTGANECTPYVRGVGPGWGGGRGGGKASRAREGKRPSGPPWRGDAFAAFLSLCGTISSILWLRVRRRVHCMGMRRSTKKSSVYITHACIRA